MMPYFNFFSPKSTIMRFIIYLVKQDVIYFSIFWLPSPLFFLIRRFSFCGFLLMRCFYSRFLFNWFLIRGFFLNRFLFCRFSFCGFLLIRCFYSRFLFPGFFNRFLISRRCFGWCISYWAFVRGKLVMFLNIFLIIYKFFNFSSVLMKYVIFYLLY